MPRQRSRSPLSPILATESATVRLFFILSVLLCSVNKAGLKRLRPGFCTVCDFAHARPIMLSILLVIGASVSEHPLACGLNGRAVTIYIYVRRRTFTATAHARRYAQTWPARSGIESVQLSQHFQPASDRDRVRPESRSSWTTN